MPSPAHSAKTSEAVASEAPDLWLGIDLGTQSVKATIVSRAGDAAASAQAPLTSRRKGTRHEQDPSEWIAAVAAVVSDALGQLAPRTREAVRGLAICSTSGTIATLDAAGAPVGPGIMYDDARGADFLADVLAADPAHWAGSGRTNTTPAAVPPRPQPSWALAKLAWLAKTGLPAGSTSIAHQGDVVAAAMTGQAVATDWSTALKSGFDLFARRWPARVLTGIGLDISLLPHVVAPGTRIGSTDAHWQELTGLAAGTPVFAGATDGCAGQFGAGALRTGSWHSVIGTTLVIKGVTNEPLSDDAAGVYSHLSPSGESWLPGGASSAGAGALSAFLPEGSDLAALTGQARLRWAEGRLPVAYPLVSPGERFPIRAPGFDGFLLPADPEADALPLASLRGLPAAEALTAIFVGVAAVERLCLERLGVLGDGLLDDAVLGGDDAETATDGRGPIRLSTSGGGARNPDWVRLRASMLGAPITRLADAEGSLGMAALAAWGAQRELPRPEPLSAIAEQMSATLDVIEPDPVLREALQGAYVRFRHQINASLNTASPQEEP